MLICPVCRSQNMDTAKFCGNCGNPFPRPAAPTSSLINCAQGHVYSAVYEYCPYCPQPESRDSDFITRVEEPITTVDPGPYANLPSPNDFATRIDSNETLFETAESPSIRPPAPPPAPMFTPTELVTAVTPEAIGLAEAEYKAEETERPDTAREDWPSKSMTPSIPQVTSSDVDRRTTVMADQSSQ